MRLSLLANSLSAASPCRAAQMCLQSALCPFHPHPAPTHIATLPDLVLAPGVQLRPERGLSQESEEGSHMPATPWLPRFSLTPRRGAGGALGGVRAAWAWVLGSVLGCGPRNPTKELTGTRGLLSCLLQFSALVGRFSSMTASTFLI